MSESRLASAIDAMFAHAGLVRNPDGTITRLPTTHIRYPFVPPSPKAISKDIMVNPINSTWMRLYVPTTARNEGFASRKLPLVVYFHGGRFITRGSDIGVHNYCNDLALSLNVVIASASYRLAPENKLPAAYEDGVDAVEWLKNSNDEWIKSHADLSNVFLMGTNSGGNVAYNVGLRYNEQDVAPLRIRGLILNKPFFGCQEPEHVDLITKLLNICWDLCLPDGADRDHDYSNPRGTMELMRSLGWRVMVTGSLTTHEEMVRQISVVNLMKETGLDVVSHFTRRGSFSSELVMADIRSFIYSSSAP